MYHPQTMNSKLKHNEDNNITVRNQWEVITYQAVLPSPNWNVVQKCTYTKIDFKFGFEDGTWLIFIPLSRSVTRLLLNRATSYVLTRFDVPSWSKWCWIRVRIWCCKMMKLGGEEEEGEEAYYCNLNAMFRLHYTPLQWMNKVAWNLNSSLLSLYDEEDFLMAFIVPSTWLIVGCRLPCNMAHVAMLCRLITKVNQRGWIASFDRSTRRGKTCLVMEVEFAHAKYFIWAKTCQANVIGDKRPTVISYTRDVLHLHYPVTTPTIRQLESYRARSLASLYRETLIVMNPFALVAHALQSQGISQSQFKIGFLRSYNCEKVV